MNKALAFLLATIFSGCVSTTVIRTVPSNSKVFVNSEYKGTTPYVYSDNKITGSETNIQIESEGYENFTFVLKRNEQVDPGAVIAGILFGIWPFLWTMEYHPERTFELKPLNVTEPNKDMSVIIKKDTADISGIDASVSNLNKYDNVRSLKKLQDDQIINAEEFQLLKERILRETFVLTNSKIDNLYKLKKLFEEDIITKEEYFYQKTRILPVGFVPGDSVRFILNKKEYIGEITKIEDEYGTVKYIYKYPLEEVIRYIDIELDELYELNLK